MSKYIKTYRYMTNNGVARDKALAAIYRAFALTPDQLHTLQIKTGA